MGMCIVGITRNGCDASRGSMGGGGAAWARAGMQGGVVALP